MRAGETAATLPSTATVLLKNEMRPRLIATDPKRRPTRRQQTEIESSRTATARLLIESRPHLIAVGPKRKPTNGRGAAARQPGTASTPPPTAGRPRPIVLRLTAIMSGRARN
jgi:hypothetical protein